MTGFKESTSIKVPCTTFRLLGSLKVELKPPNNAKCITIIYKMKK